AVREQLLFEPGVCPLAFRYQQQIIMGLVFPRQVDPERRSLVLLIMKTLPELFQGYLLFFHRIAWSQEKLLYGSQALAHKTRYDTIRFTGFQSGGHAFVLKQKHKI